MKRCIGLLFVFGWLYLFHSFDAEAQRYKRDELAAIEIVKFEAFKNGSAIEFVWDINSTMDISKIEIRKGITEPGKLNWLLVKNFQKDEGRYTEFNPSLGEIHYRLVLTAEDGTEREYIPEFRIKGRS